MRELLSCGDLMCVEQQNALNLVPDRLFFQSSNPFDRTVPKSAVADGFFSVKSGDWEDPSVWNQGKVPTDGSNALVSDGTTVTINTDEAVVKKADGTLSRNAVNMLRVDGTLRFSTAPAPAGAATPYYRRLLVDTIIVSPMNHLESPAGGGPAVWDYTNDQSMAGGSFLMGDDVTDSQGNVVSVTRMPASVKAEVVFADNGAVRDIDYTQPDHGPADPYQLGRGLVVMGRGRFYGATVTSQATVAADPKTGATTVGPATNNKKPVTVLKLASVPADWQVGDRLVINGNTPTDAKGNSQDEQFAIKSIDRASNTITLNDPYRDNNPNGQGPFKGLVYNHTAPAGGSVYLIDVSRNVILRSENAQKVANRGHVVFFHDPDAHVDAAGFYGLGRTDKRTPIDDPVLVQDYDNNGNPIPGQFTDDVLDTRNPALKSQGYRVMVPVVDANGNPVKNADGTPKLQIARTGLNPRARYALHFHHAGADDMPDGGPVVTFANDVAVVDSPGWGVVNHSSDVDVTNSVVFNATGAAFVTEAGDELGSFVHNIAMHAQGSGDGLEERKDVQDFGHQGDGFWLQGGNVALVNNVATGQRHSGFIFFPVGLNPKLQFTPGTPPEAQPTTVPLSDLPSWYASLYKKGTTSISVGDVPLTQFRGNTAVGNGDAFETWFSLLGVNDANPKEARQSVVENFTAFADGNNPVFNPYTNRLTYKNSVILGAFELGTASKPGGTAFSHNHVTRNLTWDHVTVKGFNTGVDAPVNGVNTVVAGVFKNTRNILIGTANDRGRAVNIVDGTDAPVTFLPIDAKAVPLANQFDVYLQSNFDPFRRDVTTLFNPDVIKLGTVKINGKQAFYNEQAAGFVPFPKDKAAAYIPPELIYADPANPTTSAPMTNADIFAKYGLAVGGIIAPADAHAVPRVNGLVSDNLATYPADLYLKSAKYSQFPRAAQPGDTQDYTAVPLYKLVYSYKDSTGEHKVTETAGTQLHQGWNLLTRTIAGQTRTLLVYGDDLAPDFNPAKDAVWTINKADWDNNTSWTLAGSIVDDSTGSENFRKRFKLGDRHFFTDLFAKVDDKGVTHTYTTFSMTINDRA
ncbi:MAG: hypothetical protein U0835_26625, partial [Isosphaeraceae bacterium]